MLSMPAFFNVELSSVMMCDPDESAAFRKHALR